MKHNFCQFLKCRKEKNTADRESLKRLVYELRINQHYTLREISKYLNERGYRRAFGTEYNHNHIIKILQTMN